MGTSVAQVLHCLAQENQTQPDIQNELQCLTGFLETITDSTLAEMNTSGITMRIAESISRRRLCNLKWTASCPSRKSVCALLRLARVLFRDRGCVDVFHSIAEHSNYIQFANYLSRNFLNYELEYTQSSGLLLNVTQKLIYDAETAAVFVRAQIVKCMLRFLNCREMTIQQGALEILGRVADWSAVCRVELCASTAIDVCLQLIPQGDLLTQKLCVSLLRILSCEEQAREQIRIYDGVPLLVRLLSVRNSRLQWHVAWSLAQLAEDPETSTEIVQMGGISLILAEFVDLKAPAKALNDWIAMVTGLCALLAQLCQCDSNQYHLVNNNGVYLLGKALLLSTEDQRLVDNQGWRSTQCSIFRVLRILFSLERNRGLFKKVFPIAFFEQFIDIGHYVQDLSAYRPLAVEYSKLIENSNASDLKASWEGVNQKRAPIGRVAEYDLLDQLGAGAFGCVYTVRKRGTVSNNGTPQYFALKEIFVVQLNVEEDKSFGDVISEVKIIKQQLRHPNIVRYRRIFVENHRLYILMDLIEGASLKEHITSVKEKRQTFSEDRIWNIVIQMVLALRYLHKDKQIVHRDLKPNNIMIAENDRVVVTDFGLAKKRGSEYLKSAAGTIVYSCPEIVQNMEYGEKADVWSFGCCVYEMTELHPPFYSQNMLALATQIVEGKYDPIAPDRSKELGELISACLTVLPSSRPDILEVARLAASRMLLCLDDIFRMYVSKAKISQENSNFQIQQKRENASLESSSCSSTGVLARRKAPALQITKQVPTLIDNSIDKPRPIKSLSAGQPSRNLPTSTSCILPKIGGSGRGRQVAVAEADHRRANSSGSVDKRMVKSQEGLTVRSASLQPISDPLLDILSQIHKITIISELGPSESTNHKRRVVEQFRKRIFSTNSNPEMIKKHLRLLSMESHDEIELDLGYSDFRPVLTDIYKSGYQNDRKIPRITYEQLSACIQRLIEENR
ncbi:Serine/threonine-protein kinase [Trichostrongylus colubriformis]|uniref:Serine/threonine-protein kinase n=1 Tax=Trichostrongylus colubriformis TaxID=6319 RepID=A0AAN8EPZ9_TRICO